NAVREGGPDQTCERFVMLTLADYANDEHIAWPTIKSIRLRTCLCDSAVRKILKRLAAEGWITTTLRPAPQSSIYQLHFPHERHRFKPVQKPRKKPTKSAPIPLPSIALPNNALRGIALRGTRIPPPSTGIPAPYIGNNTKEHQRTFTPTPTPQAAQ